MLFRSRELSKTEFHNNILKLEPNELLLGCAMILRTFARYAVSQQTGAGGQMKSKFGS
jgi:hypothetical protein